jgi:sec-independent protein translocase protein TatA
MGTGEIIVLGLTLVLIFSASRMGTLGNALGRFVHSFKKASQGEGFVDVTGKRLSRTAPEDAQVVKDDPPRKG